MLLGVNVAIFKDGKVLLTRREDFRVWCLPGGAADENESIVQAGMREVREETGLEVRLTRLVGIYSRPGWSDGGSHIVVFTGEVTGGTLSPDPNEVVEIGYFDPGALPELLNDQRGRIRDAAAGIGGSTAVRETARFPEGIPEPRAELYARRDQSGLARDAFYRQTFGAEDTAAEIEIEGDPAGPPHAH